MFPRHSRLWLAGILFVLALSLLAVSTLPLPHLQNELPLSTLDGQFTPVFQESRLLRLEWPQRIYTQDSDTILLSIVMDEQRSQAVEESFEQTGGDIYDTHNVVAVARLEVAGLGAGLEEVREPLRPGREAVFRWRIRASEAGQYRGVVWLHLELVPLTGGTAEQVLLLARSIEVDAVTVLGMPAALARIFGLLSLLVSLVLSFPYFHRWTRRIWRGRRPPLSTSAINNLFPYSNTRRDVRLLQKPLKLVKYLTVDCDVRLFHL